MSNTKKGKGKALKADEKAYIDTHYHLKTDEQLAIDLDRSKDTIYNYRHKMGLTKNYRGEAVNPPEVVTREQVAEEVDYDKKAAMWKSRFQTSKRYKVLSLSLTPDDLGYFMEMWSEYHVQFNDLTPSEEDTLEVLIGCKIRLLSNQRAVKTAQEYEKELKDQMARLGVSNVDAEIEEQRRLYETLISNNKMLMELNKDYKDLTDRYQRLLESLNGTRQQREEKSNISGATFFKFLKQLNDRHQRIEIGRQTELLKISTQKKMENLETKLITFADGQEDFIVLDGERFKKIYEEEDKKDDGNAK